MTRTIKYGETASFSQRLAAYLLDWLLLGLVRLPLRLLLRSFEALTEPVLFKVTGLSIILWLLTALYFVLMTRLCGGTLGKLALRLRVRDKSGAPLTLWQIVLRETVGRYLSSVLCIGYLVALFRRDHAALHDLICDSRVINYVTVQEEIA